MRAAPLNSIYKVMGVIGVTHFLSPPGHRVAVNRR